METEISVINLFLTDNVVLNILGPVLVVSCCLAFGYISSLGYTQPLVNGRAVVLVGIVTISIIALLVLPKSIREITTAYLYILSAPSLMLLSMLISLLKRCRERAKEFKETGL